MERQKGNFSFNEILDFTFQYKTSENVSQWLQLNDYFVTTTSLKSILSFKSKNKNVYIIWTPFKKCKHEVCLW